MISMFPEATKGLTRLQDEHLANLSTNPVFSVVQVILLWGIDFDLSDCQDSRPVCIYARVLIWRPKNQLSR